LINKQSSRAEKKQGNYQIALQVCYLRVAEVIG